MAGGSFPADRRKCSTQGTAAEGNRRMSKGMCCSDGQRSERPTLQIRHAEGLQFVKGREGELAKEAALNSNVFGFLRSNFF